MGKLTLLVVVTFLFFDVTFASEKQNVTLITSKGETPQLRNSSQEPDALPAEVRGMEEHQWGKSLTTSDEFVGKTQLPEVLIRAGEENDYVVLVEKSSQKLHVYDAKYNKIKTIVVTTGMNRGDKLRLNDKKTPEGVYFFTDVMEEKELFPEYGVMALATDYPNPVDVANNKNGSGIWLHATNQPERPLTPYDTRGCVVGVNEDILEIARYINLESTPIVIVEKLVYSPPSRISNEREEILDFLGKWEDSWEKKEIDSYISAYSTRFRSKGMNVKGWKRYKKRLNRKYKDIRVEIENPRIVKADNYAVVAFKQMYESDIFLDIGIKKLYLNKENQEWKIVSEEWRDIPTENPRELVNNYLQRVASRVEDKEAANNRENGGDKIARLADNRR